MNANAFAFFEAISAEVAFVRAKRAQPGGSWFNIAKMLGRSEADVRRVYGFIDKLPVAQDFDPRVTYPVPTHNDDGDGDDDDDAPRAAPQPTVSARMHALRAIAREPLSADALAELTGWSQTGARKALLRLRDVGFAVQSHSGIWSITQKGRMAHDNLERLA